ncbi:MAG: hypothetical protein HQL63_10620 [Magnetococcales bacterium]|nr:hypothetical protein [Magnetococcales bacterium]MBF0322299.1 hypothetical protein [Magnetococcales bacterium]
MTEDEASGNTVANNFVHPATYTAVIGGLMAALVFMYFSCCHDQFDLWVQSKFVSDTGGGFATVLFGLLITAFPLLGFATVRSLILCFSGQHHDVLKSIILFPSFVSFIILSFAAYNGYTIILEKKNTYHNLIAEHGEICKKLHRSQIIHNSKIYNKTGELDRAISELQKIVAEKKCGDSETDLAPKGGS